jgi:glycosyltransferase involved in cell wall biosynthesis
MCRITICTPTFNRKNELPRLYQSLSDQTDRDFEWIIVDDGSTDGTKEYLDQTLPHISDFSCRYIHQANQGKHVALNEGVKASAGELFFIVDSDDWLPNDAVQKIKKIVNSLTYPEKYAGVAGLKAYANGKDVGTTFEGEYIDCTSLQRKKHHITGDKAEIFFTDVLRKFPFPAFEGENFLTESVVWYRIAHAGYPIRWTNDIVYYCEYLSGGLSHTTHKCSRNFEGFKLTVREELLYRELSPLYKIQQIVACGAIAKEKKQPLRNVAKEIGVPRFLFSVSAAFGFIVKKIRG